MPQSIVGTDQRTAWLVDAVRTPFGAARGALSGIRADDLAAMPIAELVGRQHWLDPVCIDEVVWGNANGAGDDNRNLARMASLLAGLPVTVPGMTVNRLCGSGAEAVVSAARRIVVGDAEVVIAGGSESMSCRSPRGPRVAAQAGIGADHGGMADGQSAFPGGLGGNTRTLRGADRRGEGHRAVPARRMGAALPHLAATAWANGVHDGFVSAHDVLARDESIREPDAAAMAALRPAFSAADSVTAGNSSPISDGSVAALLASTDVVARWGVQPLGRVVCLAVVGIEPQRFAVAQVPAIGKALSRAGLSLTDVHVLELNEAFAAMVLACADERCGLDLERVNPGGGAIAMGHPLGGSAARIVVDCLRRLRARGGGIGVAAACIGVGQGIAIVVEA
jgi:acetyl-CoA acetyltransferase